MDSRLADPQALSPAEPLRILVVDDEASARRRMLTLLREIGGTAAVGEAADAAEALAQVRALRPDMLLLDIDMPGASGIELTAELASEAAGDPPAVVFVTAFDRFAVEAFGVAATDYLLKPVPLERLRTAIERVCASRAGRHAQDRLAAMKSAAPARQPGEDAFWVQGRGARHRVAIADILLIEAEHDHVRLHTSAASHLLRDRIGRMEGVLDAGTFVRVHRSAIVRRTAIREVRHSPQGTHSLRLEGGHEVPVGRKYLDAVRRLTRSG